MRLPRLADRRVGGLACCAAIVAAAVGGGCGPDAPAPPPAPTTSQPIDQLDPDELPEGRIAPFGLPLPAPMRVLRRTDVQVIAEGRAPLEAVSNYFRARLDAGSVVTGPGKTLFERVTVKSPRGGPEARRPLDAGPNAEERMRVEVSGTSGMTRVVISRTVVPKPKEGLSEEQRWERMGVGKDGKPADPQRFE